MIRDQTRHAGTPDVAALLRFEDAHYGHTGGKEELIRAELDITPARYYQLLDRAIDTVDALRIDPMLTHRLLRRRQAAEDNRRTTLNL